MSPRSFRHVNKRGSIYQYQRRVPKAVLVRPEAHQLYFRGQSSYRKSLGTGLYAEALARASTAEIVFDGLVAAATGILPATNDVRPRPNRALDAAGLADVARHVRDREVRDWRRDIVRAEIDPEAAEHLHWRIENAIAAQNDKRDPLVSVIGSSSVRETARQLNIDLGFYVDERSEGFGELIRATSDGYVQARADVQNLLQGKSLPDVPTSTLITTFGKQVASPSKAPKFTEVASAQEKVANYAPKTIEKVRRAHQRFLDVVGDKPIDVITHQDIQSFLDAVSVQTVGKRADTDRTVSRNTVQSYLTQVSSPLAFAIGRGWREGPNPAANIDLANWVAAADPATVPPKRRFEISELNRLFAHPWFAGCKSAAECYRPGPLLLQDMRYWAPVLALYSRVDSHGDAEVLEANAIRYPGAADTPTAAIAKPSTYEPGATKFASKWCDRNR